MSEQLEKAVWAERRPRRRTATFPLCAVTSQQLEPRPPPLLPPPPRSAPPGLGGGCPLEPLALLHHCFSHWP